MRFVVVVAFLGCKYTAPTAPGDDTPGEDAAAVIDVAEPPPDAWLDPWTHRKAITIKGVKVSAPTGGLIDFPVVIVVDDPEITTVANAGKTDVVFTAGDAMTLLASENEVVAGDRLVAWVKLPVLDSIADTRIYLYYGNAAPPDHDPEAVWTASFLGAWHLSQNPAVVGAEATDATSNHHHGTPQSMEPADLVSGPAGGAYDFDGTAEFINISSVIDVGNLFTLSGWVNLSTTAGTGIRTIFSNSLSGLNQNGYRLFVNSDSSADHRLLFETSNGNATNFLTAVTDVNKITAGEWTHVAVVADRSAGKAQIFVNGSDQTLSADIRTDFQNSSDCEIARMEDIFRWKGQLDEIELASVKRPPEWILTSYSNQVDAGAFYLVGGQELAP